LTSCKLVNNSPFNIRLTVCWPGGDYWPERLAGRRPLGPCWSPLSGPIYRMRGQLVLMRRRWIRLSTRLFSTLVRGNEGAGHTKLPFIHQPIAAFRAFLLCAFIHFYFEFHITGFLFRFSPQLLYFFAGLYELCLFPESRIRIQSAKINSDPSGSESVSIWICRYCKKEYCCFRQSIKSNS
jgi:hypothetical protein